MTGIPRPDAPERTALAWQRTGLSALVLILPSGVLAVRLGLWVLALLGLAAALVAAGFVLSVRRRLVELEGGRQVSPLLPIAGAAGVTLLSATGGIAVGVALWLR